MAIIFVEDDSLTVKELVAKIAAGNRVVIRHEGIAVAEVQPVADDPAIPAGDAEEEAA